MYLFFDTETTGLPDKKLPLKHELQPHICQLAAIETNDSGKTVCEINFLIKPEGWVIPEQTSKIHGITQDSAEKYGMRIEGVIAIMRKLVSRSRLVVAHNIEFDAWMLQKEAQAIPGRSVGLADKSFCTMEKSREILKLPPTAKMVECGMKEFKRPNLQEAYRHFFGKDFEDAHNAMADVRACRDVFFALKNLDAAPSTGAAA